jgi:hypothetical protein
MLKQISMALVAAVLAGGLVVGDAQAKGGGGGHGGGGGGFGGGHGGGFGSGHGGGFGGIAGGFGRGRGHFGFHHARNDDDYSCLFSPYGRNRRTYC